MGLTKLGITLAEQCARYAKTCGKSAILHTKPVHVSNLEGLRYIPSLEKDTVQLSKNLTPADFFLKLDLNINEAQREKILSGLKDFTDDKISHWDLQHIMIDNGIGTSSLPQIFTDVFSKCKNFKPFIFGKNPDPEGYVYRSIGKSEYDKLIKTHTVDTKGAFYKGKIIDVTTRPDSMIVWNNFAMVKFKYTIADPKVTDHKPWANFYHLQCGDSYTLEDVVSIDRILPNGYMNIFKDGNFVVK